MKKNICSYQILSSMSHHESHQITTISSDIFFAEIRVHDLSTFRVIVSASVATAFIHFHFSFFAVTVHMLIKSLFRSILWFVDDI